MRRDAGGTARTWADRGLLVACPALYAWMLINADVAEVLRDKIERDSSFGAQFAGRIAPITGVKGRAPSDAHQVQTITGATISSRAVIRIMHDAIVRWQPFLDAYREEAKP